MWCPNFAFKLKVNLKILSCIIAFLLGAGVQVWLLFGLKEKFSHAPKSSLSVILPEPFITGNKKMPFLQLFLFGITLHVQIILIIQCSRKVILYEPK